jgi:hypothetical protein
VILSLYLFRDNPSNRIDGLEGESSGGTSIKTSFELHGRDIQSEVETCDCGGHEAVECALDCGLDGSGSNCWGRAEKG